MYLSWFMNIIIDMSRHCTCLGFCWLCCAVGQCFNLRFMYLILMYIDISFEMFTLIDGKGVVLCMCVYLYMW